MKRLLGLLFCLCAMCFSSVFAVAEESGVQIQQREHYVPPPPKPQSVFISQQTVTDNGQQIGTPVQQGVTVVQQQENPSNSQASQDLQQFAQQAKQEIAQ